MDSNPRSEEDQKRKGNAIKQHLKDVKKQRDETTTENKEPLCI
jgi:hypothetical protein